MRKHSSRGEDSSTLHSLGATIVDEKGAYVGNVILYFYLQNDTCILSNTTNPSGYTGGNYIYYAEGKYYYYVVFEGNGNYSTTNSSTYLLGLDDILPVVNLTITKNVSTTKVLYDQEIVYTITVTNNGYDNATGVKVTDLLDSRLVYVTDSNLTNTSVSDNHLTWNIDNLAVDQTVTLTITVRVNGTGNINNIANVAVNEPNIGMNNTEGTFNANFTIPKTVNLTILKVVTLPPAGVTVGDVVVYTINVTNHGPDIAHNIIVTDLLDTRLVYVTNSNLTNTTVVGNLLTWKIATLAINQTVSMNISVRVTGTGNIDNVANVTVTEKNIGMNSSEKADFFLEKTVNLTITKNATIPANVTIGSVIVYTINVTNNGPDTATVLCITDVIDDRLANVIINDTSKAYLSGNRVIWTPDDLLKGQSVSLTITVTVVGTGTIDNIANLTVNELNIGKNSSKTSFYLPNTVNFTITKTKNHPDGSDPTVGSLVVYNITVANYGPDDGTNVRVIDKLDSRLIFESFVGDRGTTYDPVTGVWNIGDLEVNEILSLVIEARINGTGDIYNMANITATEPNVGDKSTGLTAHFYLPPTVNLTIVKMADIPSNVTVGSMVVYTIIVTNHGPDIGTNVVVKDVLDSRLYYVGSTSNKGTYSNATGNWNIGTLNVGQTVQLSITVNVRGTGLINNVANVTVNEINIGMNNSERYLKDVELILVDTVNLTITKTATPVSTYYGNTFIFNITVINNGPDAGTGINVTYNIDSRLTYISSDGEKGTTYIFWFWFVGNW